MRSIGQFGRPKEIDMVNLRNYGAGVITGLVSLAQGTCYWPDCDERLIRLVDGAPVNNFETAHICAANPGGRRYVAGMTDAERNAFDNLILLCLVHHKIVDKIRPDDFTIETLRAWKVTREAAGHAALRGLRGLTEDRLQEMLTASLGTFRDQLDDALAELQHVNSNAADLLRPLINDLADAQLHHRLPDEDVATMLAGAAERLANLEDSAATLADAADKLANLEDNATTLADAAEDLRNLEDLINGLSQAANELRQARQYM
jgi:hypothetical protein